MKTMMISAGLLLVLFSNSLVHSSSLSPFDVPAVEDLFRCDGSICAPGQDCIDVNGTPRCADPCKHFSILNDTWRANDHLEDLSDPHCDDEIAWKGWYRMYLGDTSVRMPERCQPIKMCGTHAPSFLVQPHPQVGDGVQKHTICATWENGCCKFHLNPIHVKACAGNYVVYKFVNPQDCRVCYCADINTKVCATCGANEACVSDDKISYRCEKKEQKDVLEHEDDGAPLSPFDVPAVKELFRCGGEVCPPGQDCIDVNGTPSCADPCDHYSVLNDTWRATNNLEDLSDEHCDDDVAWKGWYRMYLGDTSVRMPERCQPIKYCGTHAPSFLVQPHPQVGDGVQRHTICATWENGCCKFHLNPIHVKACVGNYVVYKFVNPQDCRVAYCADVNTKVCATCGENQSCVSADKIAYKCVENTAQKTADVNAPLSPFDVPAVKELFRCNGEVCPPGQDCITVGGTPRCADPCKHYSVLNDTWRANNHLEDLSDPHCDDEVAWEGWYRMYLGDTSVRMPERCQPIKYCGTHAPSFLVQPHPQVGDGVQKHTICATWENGCCKFHLNPIHVKACAGSYVVYKLVNPEDCRVAYCADVNTRVCATCGEDQSCVSDDKITYRCEKRQQKVNQEHDDDGTPLSPFDVPATKELFRCGGSVCPPGQDCITIGGTPSCADPCEHYSILNDTWRANDNVEDLSDEHCDDDVAWEGWYRMYLGDISIRMPERCQPIKMCGTHAPSFLVQPHPLVGDGVQKHTICATWENGCCKFHLNPIHVKACVGSFVVYKLVNPQDCRVAYCADINTKVCATCRENEACVSDDKITYRCEGKSFQEDHADNGAPLNPFDVPATKELFRCGGEVCPVGQDCITVDGTARCADPCAHYSVLNDTWRANDHFEDLSDPHCDDEVAWEGWYRMYLGDTSVRMPERCQPIKSCGTHAPSFLVQPHPLVGDGVQKHTICATWENGCCKFHLNPIHVKACVGNYIVYKLVNPQDCRVAYCADVNTKVCATCGETETCVSDDKITYRCEERELSGFEDQKDRFLDRTEVQEHEDDGTVLSPFDVPAVKELFRCVGQVCPPGQDCIKVNGVPRCADPCRHYSILNDTWRANDHFEDLSDPHCDDEVAWKGWYRMYLGDTSVRMPERCQPIKMCGTHAPSFLVQPHPQVGDGVQKHTICATWENGCCKFHLNPIHVKACVGNYVVYKFVNPEDCRVAYCADVGTKICATCRDSESCVSEDKITWRCDSRRGDDASVFNTEAHTGGPAPKEQPGRVANTNFAEGGSQDPHAAYAFSLSIPKVVCGEKFMDIGLRLDHMIDAGLDHRTAHLSDLRCHKGFLVNNRKWFRMIRKEGVCGNTLLTNGTHAIYSNRIIIEVLPDKKTVLPMDIPFSCFYSLEAQGHLSVDLSPEPVTVVAGRLSGGLTGVGPQIKPKIALFKTKEFVESYPAGKLKLPLGLIMYVSVSVPDIKEDNLVMLLDNCFQTHSSDPNHPSKDFLIQDRCSADYILVAILPTPSNHEARLSTLLVTFPGDEHQLYIHCSVSLCDTREGPCVPKCAARRFGRSISDESHNPRLSDESHNPRFADESHNPRFARSADESHNPKFADESHNPKFADESHNPRFARSADESHNPKFADESHNPKFADESHNPRFARSADIPHNPQVTLGPIIVVRN